MQCLVSAMTGIGAVQYPGGQTMHSYFAGSRWARQHKFHVACRAQHRNGFVLFIGSANRSWRELHVDAVDCLSVCLPACLPACRISLIIGRITNANHQDWNFGGWQLLFI
jgi:hypothetical protein